MAPTVSDETMSLVDEDAEITHSNEVNNNVDLYTVFTVDSACYSSYLRLGRAPAADEIYGHSTVTDGRQVPVSDISDVRMATENGTLFTLKRVCAADFTSNLLSVPEILDAGFKLIFRPSSVLFVKEQPGKQPEVVTTQRQRLPVPSGDVTSSSSDSEFSARSAALINRIRAKCRVTNHKTPEFRPTNQHWPFAPTRHV